MVVTVILRGKHSYYLFLHNVETEAQKSFTNMPKATEMTDKLRWNSVNLIKNYRSELI